MTGAGGEESEFAVPRMDCPSEERMIRTALDGVPGVRGLEFDLPGRRLTVWHLPGAARAIGDRLVPLGLGARLAHTRIAAGAAIPAPVSETSERRTLWILLAINAAMFVVEAAVGWTAESTGLIADSLDMAADAMVYGLSLYAVGKTSAHKLRAALASGWLQLALGIGALAEVVRRFVWGSDPAPLWMLGLAALALVANVSCLLLIARHRHGGAHMKASYIFSTNDAIANVGVIVAGALVAVTGSRYPDLVVGTVIAVVVLSGAVRILRMRA